MQGHGFSHDRMCRVQIPALLLVPEATCELLDCLYRLLNCSESMPCCRCTCSPCRSVQGRLQGTAEGRVCPVGDQAGQWLHCGAGQTLHCSRCIQDHRLRSHPGPRLHRHDNLSCIALQPIHLRGGICRRCFRGICTNQPHAEVLPGSCSELAHKDFPYVLKSAISTTVVHGLQIGVHRPAWSSCRQRYRAAAAHNLLKGPSATKI